VLEAVLLDAGGTVVRLDFEWMASAVSALGHAVTAEALRRGEIEGRRRYDATAATRAGRVSTQPLGSAGDIRAYFGGMLESAGVPAPLIEPALEAFLAREVEVGLWRRPMEGARETIDALERLGLRRAVVSNSDGRAEHHLRHSDVLRGLEFVVDSRLVGVEKPDPRILAIALERLGVPAERTVFVGDIRSVDEAVARAAGTHFVLIDPSGDYAGPDQPTIRSIRDLPAWLSDHFTLPARADTAHRASGGPT